MAALRSTVFLLFLIITVIPWAIASVIWSLFLPARWRYTLTTGWPRMMVWAAKTIVGIRWQIIGRENLDAADANGKAIVLANHQSTWETFFLSTHLPREVCFVYKKQLHLIPFFGWGMALLRMMPIDRSKGANALKQVLRLGKQRLDEGRWPLLFPEGTRMPPGKLGRFKHGGAMLAAHTGAPVIPIALNSGACWPRNAFIKRPGLISVSIGAPIATQGKHADIINQEVRDWIAQETQRLERMQANPPCSLPN